MPFAHHGVLRFDDTLLDWKWTSLGRGWYSRVVGDVVDIGVPGCIYHTENVLREGTSMLGLKVCHLAGRVGNVRQGRQKWTVGGPPSLYIRGPVDL